MPAQAATASASRQAWPPEVAIGGCLGGMGTEAARDRGPREGVSAPDGPLHGRESADRRKAAAESWVALRTGSRNPVIATNCQVSSLHFGEPLQELHSRQRRLCFEKPLATLDLDVAGDWRLLRCRGQSGLRYRPAGPCDTTMFTGRCAPNLARKLPIGCESTLERHAGHTLETRRSDSEMLALENPAGLPHR